jgi:hypothetical protein
MQLFQNSGLYPSYRPRMDAIARVATTFEARRRAFLDDRSGACHFLKPVLDDEPTAFFTNADDVPLQKMWAAQNGLPAAAPLETILLAQIEQHRTEVFYNMDPVHYQSDFIRRLPGCVRKSIAWRAAPSPRMDFSAYSAIVCNFPAILSGYRRMGWRAEYFSPAHDPVMDEFASNEERPIDVLFVGGYSRHHRRRAQVLEAVARLGDRYTVCLHLDQSRLNRLAESPIGLLLPLRRHKRPVTIRALAKGPIFGLDLYRAISQAKIVLNAAVDMAGDERGNMRCFEVLGCRAAMVSDAGRYPPEMDSDHTMIKYADPHNVAATIEECLRDGAQRRAIADRGFEVMRTRYSKQRQWTEFCALVQ